MFNPSIAIIGAGKAGTALSQALAEKGLRICGVASRSLSSAEKLGDKYKAVSSVKPEAVTKSAEVVFITTPDDCILDTARFVAEAGGFKPGQFVYHTSGALGPEALVFAKAKGAYTGCIHPLQTLAGTPIDKEYLATCYFLVDGDTKAQAMADKLIKLLGGTSFYIPSEGRALYHAAAATASNYLVALLYAAGQLLKKAGLTSEDGIKVLMPLVYTTLGNIEKTGPGAALTGPISRGDIKTVKRHLAALKASKEADVYEALARYTAAIALKEGTLSGSQAKKIIKLTKEHEER